MHVPSNPLDPHATISRISVAVMKDTFPQQAWNGEVLVTSRRIPVKEQPGVFLVKTVLPWCDVGPDMFDRERQMYLGKLNVGSFIGTTNPSGLCLLSIQAIKKHLYYGGPIPCHLLPILARHQPHFYIGPGHIVRCIIVDDQMYEEFMISSFHAWLIENNDRTHPPPHSNRRFKQPIAEFKQMSSVRTFDLCMGVIGLFMKSRESYPTKTFYKSLKGPFGNDGDKQICLSYNDEVLQDIAQKLTMVRKLPWVAGCTPMLLTHEFFFCSKGPSHAQKNSRYYTNAYQQDKHFGTQVVDRHIDPIRPSFKNKPFKEVAEIIRREYDQAANQPLERPFGRKPPVLPVSVPVRKIPIEDQYTKWMTEGLTCYEILLRADHINVTLPDMLPGHMIKHSRDRLPRCLKAINGSSDQAARDNFSDVPGIGLRCNPNLPQGSGIKDENQYTLDYYLHNAGDIDPSLTVCHTRVLTPISPEVANNFHFLKTISLFIPLEMQFIYYEMTGTDNIILVTKNYAMPFAVKPESFIRPQFASIIRKKDLTTWMSNIDQWAVDPYSSMYFPIITWSKAFEENGMTVRYLGIYNSLVKSTDSYSRPRSLGVEPVRNMPSKFQRHITHFCIDENDLLEWQCYLRQMCFHFGHDEWSSHPFFYDFDLVEGSRKMGVSIPAPVEPSADTVRLDSPSVHSSDEDTDPDWGEEEGDEEEDAEEEEAEEEYAEEYEEVWEEGAEEEEKEHDPEVEPSDDETESVKTHVTSKTPNADPAKTPRTPSQSESERSLSPLQRRIARPDIDYESAEYVYPHHTLIEAQFIVDMTYPLLDRLEEQHGPINTYENRELESLWAMNVPDTPALHALLWEFLVQNHFAQTIKPLCHFCVGMKQANKRMDTQPYPLLFSVVIPSMFKDKMLNTHWNYSLFDNARASFTFDEHFHTQMPHQVPVAWRVPPEVDDTLSYAMPNPTQFKAGSNLFPKLEDGEQWQEIWDNHVETVFDETFNKSHVKVEDQPSEPSSSAAAPTADVTTPAPAEEKPKEEPPAVEEPLPESITAIVEETPSPQPTEPLPAAPAAEPAAPVAEVNPSADSTVAPLTDADGDVVIDHDLQAETLEPEPSPENPQPEVDHTWGFDFDALDNE